MAETRGKKKTVATPSASFTSSLESKVVSRPSTKDSAGKKAKVDQKKPKQDAKLKAENIKPNEQNVTSNDKSVTPADKVVSSPALTPAALIGHFSKLRDRKPGAGAILSLPCEIVQNIAAFLSVDALSNFRLACKEMEDKTFWHFAHTYFKRKDFLPTRYGLQALVAMSQSRMAKYVQTLGLGPPHNDQGSPHLALNEFSPEVKNQTRMDLFRYGEENRKMRLLAQDADMIKTALQNMQGINTLRFLDMARGSKTLSWMDWCGDIERPRCNISIGASYFRKISKGKGYFHNDEFDASQCLSRLFFITLTAAEAAGLRLDCIDAGIKETRGLGLDHDVPCRRGAYNFPLDFPTVSPAASLTFANLTVLRIPFGCIEELSDERCRGDLIHRVTSFLAGLPRLETLGLYFTENSGVVSTLQAIVDTGALKSIKTFELVFIHICGHKLFEVLEPLSNSIEGLKLEDVWTGHDHENWLVVLDWIHGNMPKLKMLDVFQNDEGFDASIPFIYINCDSNEELKVDLSYEIGSLCESMEESGDDDLDVADSDAEVPDAVSSGDSDADGD